MRLSCKSGTRDITSLAIHVTTTCAAQINPSLDKECGLTVCKQPVSGADGSAEAEILSFKSAVLVFKQQIIQRHIADVDFDGQTIANVAVCCSFGCGGTSQFVWMREGTEGGREEKNGGFFYATTKFALCPSPLVL